MATLQTLRRAGVVAGVGVVALVATPSAFAYTSDVSGGTTAVALKDGTARALNRAAVRVAPVSPADATGAGIEFPITGGAVTPATVRGSIQHSGGLRFRRGRRVLRATNFIIVNRSTTRLSARVGSSRVTLAKLEVSDMDITRTATNVTLENVDVVLTRGAASALNATLHTRVFKAGLSLGTAEVDAELADLVFTGGSTSLALDAGLITALTGLGVTPGVVPPAAADTSGALNFPIVRGKVNAESLAGTVTHTGGISLTKGATSVVLTRFVVDTRAGQLTAVLSGKRIPLLTLVLSGVQTNIDGLTVTVTGAKGALSAEAAAALNAAFGTTAFRAGIAVGTATDTAEL